MTALADAAYDSALLCEPHRERARRWRDNFMDDRRPREAGGGILMDSRTPLRDLRDRWDRLNASQINIIAEICDRQCNESPRRRLAGAS